MNTNSARLEMLGRVRGALDRTPQSPIAPIPPTARFASRIAGEPEAELERFLSEVDKLGGKTRCLQGPEDLAAALQALVAAEGIKKATLWQTPELNDWGVSNTLRTGGIEVVSPYAPNREVAACDLGITTADFALPETGTLVLRSIADKPRTVSLLPRVHLAIVNRAMLRADLHQVFEETHGEGYFVFITGPSRTSDIELTLTIGVHGPQTLHVWVLP
ncbi:MAG: lactate utilization protein [Anaerolineae bacterium]